MNEAELLEQVKQKFRKDVSKDFDSLQYKPPPVFEYCAKEILNEYAQINYDFHLNFNKELDPMP